VGISAVIEYKKALERKKAQDKYEEEMRLVEKKNQERQEALEKAWGQREAELREREDELTRLRREGEGFPARLQNEAETAALRVRRETEAKFEQELLVLKKDAETEKRLAELHVRTLEETLARQASQIVTLEKQLVDAKQQVQDIAILVRWHVCLSRKRRSRTENHSPGGESISLRAPALSNVRLTDRLPIGRVRWRTPLLTVIICPGRSSTVRSSKSIKRPPSMAKNVSSESG
jgi:hypothetical protein